MARQRRKSQEGMRARRRLAGHPAMPGPEEAARARGMEEMLALRKCVLLLPVGDCEIGRNDKTLYTLGKCEFAFQKCFLMLESA